MKGLMVSLIIVLFAGTTNSVLAAGQQDAAGSESRSGLQPITAPYVDRPGPDDSEDEVAWPDPKSMLSRGSTTTSSLSDQRFASPAPESVMDKNIRFDVKVDANAINLLKQGRKVFSPVEVRDQATRAVMDPSVVSDIALFMGANAGKDLQGVRLQPEPMEFGSTTLKFEIPEQDLDRIESDAFLFNVPDELRGKFDRVEFVAVSGPSGSHEFSSDLSRGTRGTALGFEDSDGASRFGIGTNNRLGDASNNRFNGTNQAQRPNAESPQPGPGFSPYAEFTGPNIDQTLLERRHLEEQRNRLAPLDTSNRFQVAEREPAATPNRSPFSLPREQPAANQYRRDQNPVAQSQYVNRRTTNEQPNTGQRFQETAAERQLRLVQQQLADANAEKESIQRNATDWMRHAESLTQERNKLNNELQSASNRQPVTQPFSKPPVSTAPVRYATGRDYLGRAIDAAGNLVAPFGSNREDFRPRETANSGMTQTELDQQKVIEQMQSQIAFQSNEKRRLEADKLSAENRLAQALFERRPTYDNDIQPTSYNSNDNNEYVNRGVVRNPDGSVRTADANVGNEPRNRVAGGPAGGTPPRRGDENRSKDDTQESGTNQKSSSDLFWLLPLLLGSLALNFFLWVHSRSLYLRYDELAEELRGMVGASTI